MEANLLCNDDGDDAEDASEVKNRISSFTSECRNCSDLFNLCKEVSRLNLY